MIRCSVGATYRVAFLFAILCQLFTFNTFYTFFTFYTVYIFFFDGVGYVIFCSVGRNIDDS